MPTIKTATLKSIFSSCLFLLTTLLMQAQVGIGTNNPAASAQLDVSSTSKGFLPPRMTTAKRNAISNPANGLIIFNTRINALEVCISGAWYQLTSSLSTASNVTSYHYVRSVSGIYSFNGTAWAALSTNTPANLSLDHYIGQIDEKSYFKVGNDLYSFDGTTWTTVSSNIPVNVGSSTYLGVVYGKAYHNVYNGSAYELYSFDGTTWTTVSSNTPAMASSSSYLGVINGKAYHHVSNVLYQFDGTTWTTVSSNTPAMASSSSYLGIINGKAYHNISGSQLYDFNGTTWTPVTPNISLNAGIRNYLGIINGKAYHYVYDGLTSSYKLYSFDGSSWVNLSSIINPSGSFGGWLTMTASSLIAEF